MNILSGRFRIRRNIFFGRLDNLRFGLNPIICGGLYMKTFELPTIIKDFKMNSNSTKQQQLRPEMAKYSIKSLYATLCTIFWLSTTIISCLFSKKTGFWLLSKWATHMRRIFNIKVESIDRNHGNYKGPHIYVVLNQTSLVESLIFPSFVPQSSFFVFANIEYLLLPFIGWSTWALGSVLVIRQWKEQAKKSLDNAITLVHQGNSCYISVEGKRSENGRLSPYKNGTSLLGIHLMIIK
jgi:1-acyl-sn-glycerol-3-phosphate acyltransferase